MLLAELKHCSVDGASTVQVLGKAVGDVTEYRDYIRYSVGSSIKSQTAGTMLGSIWWILEPIMYMLVYVLVIKYIFQRGGPNYSVFLLCGLIPWKWTQSTIVASTSSIRGKSAVLQQIYVPKHILVLVTCLSSSVNLVTGAAVLLVFLQLFRVPATLHYLEFLPVCMTHFTVLLGLSLILAHVGVFFRDINNILAFGTRLWFFLSPTLYSMERIPEDVRWLWWLNPLTTFFESYRNVLMRGEPAHYYELSLWFLIGVLVTVLGLRRLAQFDRKYTKVV